MKTIFDAVNELMGDLSGNANTLVKYHKEYPYLCIIGNVWHLNKYSHDLGTVDDFNALVSHLENWQPTTSASPLANVTYAEYKEKFMSKSKPKLETFNGMQYEIGKHYLTSCRNLVKLISVISGDFWVSTASGSCVMVSCLIKVNQLDLGTITPAPVDLVNGEVYHFELNCDLWVGFYCEQRRSFFTQLNGGNKICGSTQASQITRLVPGVKS
jgi:hypothetical protein